MLENFLNFFEIFSILDFIFIFFLFINSLISLSNGFVLSLLSFLKWVLALILTKIFLPIIKPYTENLITSEFTHDIIIGSIIFIFSIFIIILINKGLKKTINWTGFGGVDKFFGLVFGDRKSVV